MSFRYPALDIIDEIYNVLSSDSNINTRYLYKDTVDEKSLTTLFYKYINFDKVVTLLKLKENNEDLRYFNTPVIIIYAKDSVKYTKDNNNTIDRVDANFVIDVMVSNFDLQQAFKDSFILCDDIRQTLDPIQGLNRKSSTCRVKEIVDLNYLQYGESPYIYAQRCKLEVYTR